MDIIQDADESMEGRARTVAERITTRYLTKYERARVLGTRALQLRWGAAVANQKFDEQQQQQQCNGCGGRQQQQTCTS